MAYHHVPELRKLGRNFVAAPAHAPKLKLTQGKRAPDVLDRSKIYPPLQMDGNDILGDCTAVGYANGIRSVATLNRFSINIPKQKTIAFYSQSTGYNPLDVSTDAGGNEPDVLTDGARNGFDTGAQTRFYGSWGSMDPDDLNGLRLATAELGFGYLGVALALADQFTTVWDTDTPASAGSTRPGSWGGHCLNLWDWTGIEPTDTVRLQTWGGYQVATWRWLQSRMDEAHAVFFRQLQRTTALEADIGRMEADCADYLLAA